MTDRHRKKLSWLPCDCPVCDYVNNYISGWDTEKRNEFIDCNIEMREVRALHNLWWYLKEIRTYEVLIEDWDVYLEYVRLFNSPKCLEALHAVDDVLCGEMDAEDLWVKSSLKQSNIDGLF